MKKHLKTIVKTILLSFAFVMLFNVNFGGVSQIVFGQDDIESRDFDDTVIKGDILDGNSGSRDDLLGSDDTSGVGSNGDSGEYMGGERTDGGTGALDESIGDSFSGTGVSSSDSSSSDSSSSGSADEGELYLPDPPKDTTFDRESVISRIADMATYIHGVFNPMISFFAFQTGNFLGTDYIFEGTMGQMLKKIWTVSRNLVNIVFVLILLALALKEIFWVNEETSDLKKHIIKFALLLVAVNFSWLGTKVVLDAANVVTNVVFSIPMGVDSAGAKIITRSCEVESNKTTPGCYPIAIYNTFEATENTDFINLNKEDCDSNKDKLDKAFPANENTPPEKKNNDYYGKNVICWDTIDFSKYKANTSMIYLMYGMARVQNITKASSDVSFTQLAVSSLFSIIIQAAYTIALLALFIALIIRMAMLWIFVGFSPFLILLLYNEKFSAGIGDKFSVQAFAKWAFVPAKVGAVFSVAFLMISAGQTIGLTDSRALDVLGKDGAVITARTVKISSLYMGMDTLQQFIWLLITLVVLWMGVFAVLKDMPIISAITEKINGYGTSAAKWLGTTPFWAPIMPVTDKSGNVKRMSLGRMVNAPIKGLEKMRRDSLGESTHSRVYERAKELSTDDGRIKTMSILGKGGNNAHELASHLGFVNQNEAIGMGRAGIIAIANKIGGDVKTSGDKIATLLLSKTGGDVNKPKTEAEKKVDRIQTAAGVKQGELDAAAVKSKDKKDPPVKSSPAPVKSSPDASSDT